MALKSPDDLDNGSRLRRRTRRGAARDRPRSVTQSRSPRAARPGPGSPASAISGPTGSSPTTSCRRSWTPTTSGSAAGSASPSGGSPARTIPWCRWARRASAKALAEAGLQPTDIDTVIVATCSLNSPVPHAATQIAGALGHPRPRLVRSQRRLRRVLLRHRRRRPGGPGRRVEERAGRRVRAAHRLDQAGRPGDRDHLRRRGRRRGGQRVRGTRHRPGDLGQRRAEHRRDPDRGPERALHPGGPDRLPLGDHRDRARSPSGPRRRPVSSSPTSMCWSPTRPTCASSRPSPRRSISAGGADRTSRSAGTSSPPATPRRRRSRSRWTGCGPPARSTSGDAGAVRRVRRRSDLREPGVHMPVSRSPTARRPRPAAPASRASPAAEQSIRV